MKKILCLLAACSALLFVSCEKIIQDDQNNDLPAPPPPEEEKVFYEVISDENHELIGFVRQLLQENASGLSAFQLLIIPQFEKLAQNVRDSQGLDDEMIGFRKVAYEYESEDWWGNPVVLSAAAYWLGYYSGDTWVDIMPEEMCLMEHYTLTANSDCPSAGYPFELFTSGNTFLVMPDYLGFGSSSSYVHPYLIHDLCAANSIDAMPAAQELFAGLTEFEADDEWKLTVRGASQGGGNALAIHKYMDTHAAVADEWNFMGSYCAAGPYSPRLTVEKYIEAGVTDTPVLFPLTLVSMQYAYPELLGRFSADRIYSEKYLAVKDQIEDALESREKTVAQMNSLMLKLLREPDDLFGKELKLSDILSSEILDPQSEVYQALRECLDDNDLISGWIPVRPVRLYYSAEDKTVPYENSIAVSDAFGDSSVIIEEGFASDHTACCALWMFNVLNESNR